MRTGDKSIHTHSIAINSGLRISKAGAGVIVLHTEDVSNARRTNPGRIGRDDILQRFNGRRQRVRCGNRVIVLLVEKRDANVIASSNRSL